MFYQDLHIRVWKRATRLRETPRPERANRGDKHQQNEQRRDARNEGRREIRRILGQRFGQLGV